jgi:hypothetical protein
MSDLRSEASDLEPLVVKPKVAEDARMQQHAGLRVVGSRRARKLQRRAFSENNGSEH